jgi:hypothetical protein
MSGQDHDSDDTLMEAPKNTSWSSETRHDCDMESHPVEASGSVAPTGCSNRSASIGIPVDGSEFITAFSQPVPNMNEMLPDLSSVTEHLDSMINW